MKENMTGAKNKDMVIVLEANHADFFVKHKSQAVYWDDFKGHKQTAEFFYSLWCLISLFMKEKNYISPPWFTENAN